MDFLKVSSKSSPASVAGAIAGLINSGKSVRIQCVGAAAVNQTIKAVAIARGFLIPTGVDIAAMPSFASIEIDGAKRTAMHFTVICLNPSEDYPPPASTRNDNILCIKADPSSACGDESALPVDGSTTAPRREERRGGGGFLSLIPFP